MNRGCSSCHLAAKAEHLLFASDPITREQFEVVRCAACGLAWTDPRPSPRELDRYYTTGYHGAAKRYQLGLDRSLALLHRGRIRRIERLTGGPGRVLDVGCGPGWFLDNMRRRGWKTVGIERSAGAAQQARDILDLDVRAQDLDELASEGITYDAIVLWHVAEHVHDPATTLCQIAGLLRPGGVALIAVPDFGSPEARVGKAGWFHLDVPRHLFHFTPDTLKSLIAEAGLEPRKVVHIAPEYDIFSFVQTAQNRIGFPHNLLYDLLRRREARLAHSTLPTLWSTLAVASAFPLTLLGLAWAPLAAALKCSATITIYAQRPPATERAGGSPTAVSQKM